MSITITCFAANGGSGGGSTGVSGQADTCYHCSPTRCRFTTNTGGGGGTQTKGGAAGVVKGVNAGSGTTYSYAGTAGSLGNGGAGGDGSLPKGWGKIIYNRCSLFIMFILFIIIYLIYLFVGDGGGGGGGYFGGGGGWCKLEEHTA